MGSRVKRGFTLVEVLVTTIVIGVLAAVVVPALMRQTTAADPAQMASDLINIRTGLESFSIDVRPYAPGDLEDLVNPVGASDEYLPPTGLAGTAFQFGGLSNSSTVTAKWKGPYVSRAHSTAATSTGPTGWAVGSGGQVDSDLFVCSSVVNAVSSTAGSGCVAPGVPGSPDMIAIKLSGITPTEFANLNQIIDGTETTASTTGGLLRYFTSGTAVADVFFLALPYTAP